LRKDAIENRVDYIYLFPLNDVVSSIYQRAEWGFVLVHPKLKYLFHILTAPPNDAMLESIMPPNPHEFIELAINIAKARKRTKSQKYEPDTHLLSLIETAAPVLIENGASELKDVLMISEGNELSVPETREALVDYFVDLLTKYKINIPKRGGRQVSRKHRK
jgi:hypothetical protein